MKSIEFQGESVKESLLHNEGPQTIAFNDSQAHTEESKVALDDNTPNNQLYY